MSKYQYFISHEELELCKNQNIDIVNNIDNIEDIEDIDYIEIKDEIIMVENFECKNQNTNNIKFVTINNKRMEVENKNQQPEPSTAAKIIGWFIIIGAIIGLIAWL